MNNINYINNIPINRKLIDESLKASFNIDPKIMKKIIEKISQLRKQIRSYFQYLKQLFNEINSMDNKYINEKERTISNYKINVSKYNKQFSQLKEIKEKILSKREHNYFTNYKAINALNLSGFIEYSEKLLKLKSNLMTLIENYNKIKKDINRMYKNNIANVNTNDNLWNFK